MTDSVGQYLNEIGLVPLLTAMEERSSPRPWKRGEGPRRHRGRRRHPGEPSPRPQGRRGQGPLHPRQPPPRRLGGPPLPPGHGAPGPHPGGQPRPRARRRQVRLAQGLQVLHLRHVLDPQAIGRALDQKASLVRLPGDRSASLAALRQVSGDGDELDEENAALPAHRPPASTARSATTTAASSSTSSPTTSRAPRRSSTRRSRPSSATSSTSSTTAPAPRWRALRSHRRSQAQLPRGRRDARRHRRGRDGS